MVQVTLEPLKIPDRLRMPTVFERKWTEPANKLQPRILLPASFTAPSMIAPGEHRVFIVFNRKGGAGKTTTTLELACAWAAMGYTVRIIDADPQDAGLTGWLQPVYPEGLSASNRLTLKHVMYGEAGLDDATYYTRYKNIYIVPSYEDCAVVEYDPAVSGERVLRRAIKRSEAPVDITIVDCPPKVGKLSTFTLAIGGEVLVPNQVSGLDAMSNDSLRRTIADAQEEYDVQVRAAVLTAWGKTKIAQHVGNEMAEHYPGALVCPIRRSVDATTAPDEKMSIREYNRRATTTRDFDQLGHMLVAPRGATA
ncbi:MULTISPECIES: ParA family protein [unclassified Streptomyces]|uniref:ParA family protein n=1 Tax=unclassified Streptomyces TaxID=2593676 RepID=UPI000DC7CE14|nr:MULTISPECIES: ParA family protein [unclassified Streptomyces]AWZ07412.1 ParA family protein [Streptomyces sp. ICC4]AWZ12660.1 ParA family protein [Streptomyces sp. ICC1]